MTTRRVKWVSDSTSTTLSKNVNRQTFAGRIILAGFASIPAVVMAVLSLPLLHGLQQAKVKANYYEMVVENLSKPVVVVDIEGRIVLANSAAEEIFGYSQENPLEGRSVEELSEGGITGAAYNMLREYAQVMSPGDIPDQVFQTQAKQLGGAVFDVEIFVRVIEKDNGMPLFVAVVETLTTPCPSEVVQSESEQSATRTPQYFIEGKK